MLLFFVIVVVVVAVVDDDVVVVGDVSGGSDRCADGSRLTASRCK